MLDKVEYICCSHLTQRNARSVLISLSSGNPKRSPGQGREVCHSIMGHPVLKLKQYSFSQLFTREQMMRDIELEKKILFTILEMWDTVRTKWLKNVVLQRG